MVKDKLGNRMKKYEDISRIKLPERMPVILRIDGKAFHTYTKGLEKPFSQFLASCFWEATKYVAKEMMGFQVAYHQSDEVSFLLTNYKRQSSESWFDNNIQKLASVTSSMFTFKFNELAYGTVGKPAFFDCRAYVIPKDEVINYFIWRQQDATKNSISMVASSEFTFDELQGLNGDQKQEKLFQERDINWGKLPTWQKRGTCIVREEFEIDTDPKYKGMKGYKEKTIRPIWVADMEIPIFTQDRNYIEKFV